MEVVVENFVYLFDLSYKAEATSTPLRAYNYLTPPSILKNMSMEYINKNVAVVHLFYRESVFHGVLKNVYVGFTEFLCEYLSALLLLCPNLKLFLKQKCHDKQFVYLFLGLS